MVLVALAAVSQAASEPDPRQPRSPAAVEDPRLPDPPSNWERSAARSRYRAGNWTVAAGLGIGALGVVANDGGWASAGVLVATAGSLFATTELSDADVQVSRVPLVVGIGCGLGAIAASSVGPQEPASLGLLACTGAGLSSQIGLDRGALRRAGLTVSPTSNGARIAGRF